MVHSSRNILTLSNTQARELAGRFVIIGGTTYYFQNYDPGCPGQPPWRSGAEGKAYPLLGREGSMAAYLKFFTHPTQKRLNRTAWLIGQQMHTWLPNLAAAPVLWTDTRHGVRGAKIDFHFAAYLAKAVPGETWLERKSGIAGGETCFPEELRWRCIRDLLLALAALERAELVHGDLSPNNVVIDLDARPNDPALYLIDFDAFFAAAAGANRVVTVAEGGSYGTDGYCPPDVATAANAGDGSVAPYSDRYGRDMLLLELLLMGRSLSAEDPLAHWDREQLQRQFAAWRARSDPTFVRTLCHLDPATVFKLNEPERPTSVDLAIGLGLSLPERRVLRRVTELSRPTPAMLGCSVAQTRFARRRPPTAPVRTDDVFEDLATLLSAETRQQRVRIDDVFENLATKGSGVKGSNLTDEQLKFGCAMAAGVTVVIMLVLLAGFFASWASGPKDDSSELFDTLATVLAIGSGFGFFVLLCFALGYFVNRD